MGSNLQTVVVRCLGKGKEQGSGLEFEEGAPAGIELVSDGGGPSSAALSAATPPLD